jgi:hypothetical protein
MKILNNILIKNKSEIIEKVLRKTIINQQSQLFCSTKLLTKNNKNIVSFSESNDLMFPSGFLKTKGSFLNFKQTFYNTPLYFPFLTYKQKKYFIHESFTRLIVKHNVTKVFGVILGITSQKRKLKRKKINSSFKSIMLRNQPVTNILWEYRENKLARKPKKIISDIKKIYVVGSNIPKVYSIIRVGVLGVQLKLITFRRRRIMRQKRYIKKPHKEQYTGNRIYLPINKCV